MIVQCPCFQFSVYIKSAYLTKPIKGKDKKKTTDRFLK